MIGCKSSLSLALPRNACETSTIGAKTIDPILSGMPDLSPDMRPLVLVVEDEPLVRMTLVDVLEDAVFKIIEAAHADEALRVLKAVSGIDAVVTDVEMPPGQHQRLRAGPQGASGSAGDRDLDRLWASR